MAVVKTAVDLATLTDAAVGEALAHYGRRLAPSSPPEKLHNGYSGCNYRVLTQRGGVGEPQGGQAGQEGQLTLEGAGKDDVVDHREMTDVLPEPHAARVRAHLHVILGGHEEDGEDL